MELQALKGMSQADAIAAAEKYAGVAPGVLDGIWRTETARGTHPTMIGPDTKWGTAKGHFQFLDNVHASIEKKVGAKLDRFNFHEALFGAAELMKENKARYGTDEDAVRAYHGGTNKNNWGAKTADYVEKVFGRKVAPSLPVAPVVAKDVAAVQSDSAWKFEPSIRAAEVGAATVTAAGAAASRAELERAQGVVDATPFFGAQTNRESIFGAAYSSTFSPYFDAASRMLEDVKDDADPVFLTDLSTNMGKYVDGFSQDERAELLQSTNKEDYAARVNRLLTAREDNAVLSRTSGAGQFAALTLAGVLDPMTYATGLAATKAFAVAGYGSVALAQQGRTGVALASAVGEGIVGNVSYDVVRAALGEHKSALDFAVSAATGILPGALQAPGIVKASAWANSQRLVNESLAKQAGFIARAVADLGEAAPQEAIHARATEYEVQAMRQEREALTAVPGDTDRVPAAVDPDEVAKLAAQEVAEDVPAAPAQGLAYEPRPTIGGDVAENLYNNGLLAELRSADDLPSASPFYAKYGDAIPDDAKALYSPQDDKVYVFRDRLTPEDVANPQGLIAHEVGVHYGLERAVGTDTFTKVLTDLDADTSKAVAEARARVPEGTPAYLRGEEMLGYLVEAAPNLPVVRKLLATVRNWLRDNVKLFKGLKVTVDDAVRYVQGSVKRAARGPLSADLTFPFVWHGGPTKGIDQLDTKFAGTGEGNAAFGFGNYVTSERGTALDYRNKESKRRGMAPEEGGLYRVRITAARESMLDWDKPVRPETAALFPGLPAESGEVFYKALTAELGSQKAASEALAKAGVPGLTYVTGRTRGKGTTNQNYVLFSNEATDIAARFSMQAKGTTIAKNKVPSPAQLKAQAEDAKFAEFDAKYGLDTMPVFSPQERMEKKAIRDILAKAEAYDLANPVDVERLKSLADNSVMNFATPGLLLAKSKHPLARMLSATMVENSMGAGGRKVTAAIRAAQLGREYVGNALVNFDNHYTLWRNKTAGGKVRGALNDVYKGSLRDDFNKLVAREVEGRIWGRPGNPDPNVKAAADALEVSYERMRLGQVETKTVGWGVLPTTSRGYMPHKISAGKLAQADNDMLRAWMDSLTSQFMELSDMDEAFAKQVAAQYVGHARTNANGGHEIPSSVHSPHAADYVRQALKAMGLTSEEIAVYANKLAAGGATHTKARLKLDLLAEYTRADGSKFTLLDMFDTDHVTLLRNQARRVSGEVALTGQGILGAQGLQLVEQALKFRPAGVPHEPQVIEAYQQVAAEIIGRPYGEASPAWLDGVMTLNSVANLGGMSITQLGEYINMAVGLGIGHAAKAAGSMPRLISEVKALARGEKVENSILNSMEIPDGGGEFGMHGYKMITRFDNPNSVYDTVGHSGTNAITRALRASGHALGTLTMHRMIQAVQSRGAAEQITIKALKFIRDGKESKALADMGFTPEVVAGMKADLDNMVVWGPGGGVQSFDIRKASNPEVAQAFVSAVTRGAGQLIQEAFVGELGKFHHSALGKMLTQFRTFPLLAVEKQFGRNRAMHGVPAVLGMIVAASAFAVPIHLARVALNAVGRDDQDEYIEKMTSPLAIGRATMNYVGLMGLAPDVLDGLSAIMPDDMTKDSGLATRTGSAPTIGGIVPVLGYGDTVLRATANLDNPHYLARTLPLSNVWWLTPAVNTLRPDAE